MNIIQLVFLLLFVCSSFKCVAANGIGNNTNNIMCVEEDRQALFKFKHKITYDSCGLLSTWTEDSQNCCHWHGVRCDNITGRVIKLSLRGVMDDEYDVYDSYTWDHVRCLEGRLSSSVVDLKHLTYLDLSLNNFTHQQIPSFIGSLVNLKHLDLSDSEFEGEIPHQLGNLSSLISLDLSFNYERLYVNDLSWLSRLTRLTSLNLSNVDLSSATNWSQIVNNLPFLRILQLDHCDLSSPVIPRPRLSFKNSSTTLHFLSLVGNRLNDSSIRTFEWLFNLSGINTHLAHLDLSFNQLGGPLPSAFGNMHSLSYLDLSHNQLGGPLPSAFGNLHSLSYLDLSVNQFQGNIPPSLFGNMHSLTYLNLEDNQLEGPIPDTISNIKPLTELHLSYNNFQSLPKTLGNLCRLQVLWLYNNSLSDELPTIIQSLSGCANKSLLFLDLGFNQIWGSIPDSIGVFFSLRELSLWQNKLDGSISESLGQLSMLETLDLYSNNLKGSISNIHFSNLSKLRKLYLGNNSALTLNVSDDWVPPFQLDTINLRNSRLGPLFPKWIMTQTNYSYLDLSNAGISGNIPNSFWKTLPLSLDRLNISCNNFTGTLPTYLSAGRVIDLSFNNIEGAIPIFPNNIITTLLLNNNRFSNPIPFLCSNATNELSTLDLSNNLLNGKLPNCWMNFPNLKILHLENNIFSGVIPSSIVSLKDLEVLHLRNNSISGGIQGMFENLTSLVLLDLGHNSLRGRIPPSIGTHMKNLCVFRLANNKFDGAIPISLCKMPILQVLDLSSNHFSGSIPKCIGNFSAMKNEKIFFPQLQFQPVTISGYYVVAAYTDTATIMWKREERTATIMWKREERSFGDSLGQVKQIHLSNNKLEGEIPIEISFLKGLKSLDLSRNNLVGGITPKIGELKALEYLNLSSNHLSGEIPTSFIDLNFLSMFDVSNNNLSGKIPPGSQLQGFDASAYMGNPRLCGLPLPKCAWDQLPSNTPSIDNNMNHHDDEKEDDNFILGLCISVVLGFIVGFWGVCGTLVLKRSWRLAFFRSFDNMRGKARDRVSMIMARVRRRQ